MHRFVSARLVNDLIRSDVSYFPPANYFLKVHDRQLHSAVVIGRTRNAAVPVVVASPNARMNPPSRRRGSIATTFVYLLVVVVVAAVWTTCLGRDVVFCEAFAVGRLLIDGDGNGGPVSLSRRDFLQRHYAASAAILTCNIVSSPSPAWARNLPPSTGADLSKVGTVETLVPILLLRQTIQLLLENVETETGSMPFPSASTTMTELSSASSPMMLFGIPTREDAFKRLFDAYSVPVSYKQQFLDQNAFLVYYTKGYDGPGRHNLERGDSAGGEEVVNQLQTMQFGARNEVWLAWEAFLAEWNFYTALASTSSSATKEERYESVAEMRRYLSATILALDEYLRLAPPDQLEKAQERASSTSSLELSYTPLN